MRAAEAAAYKDVVALHLCIVLVHNNNNADVVREDVDGVVAGHRHRKP